MPLVPLPDLSASSTVDPSGVSCSSARSACTSMSGMSAEISSSCRAPAARATSRAASSAASSGLPAAVPGGSPSACAPRAAAVARAAGSALTTMQRPSPPNVPSIAASVLSSMCVHNCLRSSASSTGASRVLPVARPLTGTIVHACCVSNQRRPSVRSRAIASSASAAERAGEVIIVSVTHTPWPVVAIVPAWLRSRSSITHPFTRAP